jgi:hypothetical protein
MDAGVREMSCCDLTAALEKIDPKVPIVVISSPNAHDCEGADHMLESFEPNRLLDLLRSLVPEATAAIEKRNEKLAQELP